MRWRRAIIVAIVAVVTAATLVTIRHWPREPLAERIASSTAIFDHQGRLLRLTLASDHQYRLWTPLENISPELVESLLLHEDQHFYWHPGFNVASLVRAAVSTYTGGPRVGGSTITMQLARLMYGLNTRTISGKLEQIARAIELELCYSKRDLLEAHLNLMPYGGNIQGVGAASLIYFDKSASRLGLSEALTLVLIPQSPARRAPEGDEPADLREARMRLFARWVEQHPDAADAADYMATPLRYASLHDLPFAAPHFTNAVLQRPRPSRSSFGEYDAGSANAAKSRTCLTTYVREHRQHRHSQRRGDAGRLSRSLRARHGRLGRFLRRRYRRPGERHAGQALARLGAQTFHLCAGHRPRRDSSANGIEGHADRVRTVQSRELRRPLRRPDHRTRSVDSLAQCAGTDAGIAAVDAIVLSIPAQRRHHQDGEREALWSRAHAWRWRSHYGRNGDPVCDARESRAPRAAAISRR